MNFQALISEMLVAKNSEVLSAVSYKITEKLHSKRHTFFGCECDICQKGKVVKSLKQDLLKKRNVLDKYGDLYSDIEHEKLHEEYKAIQEQLHAEKYELEQLTSLLSTSYFSN